MNDIHFSVLICCTLFFQRQHRASPAGSGVGACTFEAFRLTMASPALCPTSPHVAQVVVSLHVLMPWPNIWRLKHRSRLGMKTETGTRMKPNFRCFGIVGRLNVTMEVLALRRPSESSFTEISVISLTYWSFSSDTISCVCHSRAAALWSEWLL